MYKAPTFLQRVLLGFGAVVAGTAFADGESRHRGPSVAAGTTGPARYTTPLYHAFEPQRAMETVAFADQYYREPGNEGFEATIDHLVGRLEKAGFGKQDGFELRIIETPLQAPAWTPRRALLEVLLPDGSRETLHRFEPGHDRDRTMLPTHAPSAQVEGEVIFSVDELDDGKVLVVDGPLFTVLRRAQTSGAAAVLTSQLASFNVDPHGTARHLDAIHYGRVRPGTEVPVAQISPRTFTRLTELKKKHTQLRVRFEAKVDRVKRPLRTVVATIVGERRPNHVVAVAAHVQEPGAVDNASGIGGLLESACTLSMLLREKAVRQPAASVAFIWGDEMAQSRIFLEHTPRTVIAGISADMIGASREKTGAQPLLERDPDPGALRPISPDAHTPWGAGSVSKKDVRPNGLSLIARTALHDVGALVGGWLTGEHPWEGGSDHDIFLRKGIPAILFWHFTDFAYHTSLDRLSHVDAEVLRRMSTAVVTTALAVADPDSKDLERYLKSLRNDRELRVRAARALNDEDTEAQWQAWFDQAEKWLRNLCHEK